MPVSKPVTARRLVAAALAAGAVVGAVTLPASAADHRPHQPKVEISKAQYDSPGRDDQSNRSLNKEWVEITNNSRHSVNLDGWTLSAKDGRTYTFHHYRLDGRATVRVHTGVGSDTRTDVFQDRRTYAWDNYSDTATLSNDRGRTIDDFSWGRHHRDGSSEDSWGRHHHRGDDSRGRHDHRGDDSRGRHDHRGDGRH